MKKLAFTLSIILSAIAIQAQSLYTIVNPVVERKTVIEAGTYEVLNAGLINNSTSPINISFKQISKKSPEDWVVSLCGPTNCFTPGSSSFGDKEIIKVSAKTQIFEVNWTAKSPGKGEIVYEITDLAKPTDKRLVTFILTAELPLSTDLYISKNTLKIYPNPAKDFINVEFPDNSYMNIILTNAAGKVISTQPITDLTLKLDVSLLEKGIYLITSSGNSLLRKTVIIY